MFDMFGLRVLSEPVYRALLIESNRSVGAIAEEISADADEVREAVEELVAAGLVRRSLDNPDILRPVSPEIGFGALLSQHEADLLSRRQRLEESRASLNRMIAEYTELQSDRLGATMERLTDLDQVRDRIERLALGARDEQLAFVHKPVTEHGALTARPLDEQVLAKGVRMRTVFLESVRRDPVTMDYARWLTESGAQARTVPALPLRMIIYDRARAVLPIDPGDSSKGAIVLRGEPVIVALIALFEQVWQSANPIGESIRSDKDGLRPAEQELLRQLAAGDTDEAAARRLGVSLRTVRRMMGEITERLGARGRFQTALRAVERGWL